MTFVSSGRVTADVSGNVNMGTTKLGAGQTQVFAYHASASTATTTIHTVTAGKTFYLTSATGLMIGSADGYAGVTADGDTLVTGTRNTNGGDCTETVNFPLPLAFAAGKVFQSVISLNSGSAAAYITGWEE